MTVIFLLVTAFYIVSGIQTGATFAAFFQEALPNMWRVIEKFFPPNWAVIGGIWGPLGETIQMAIIATTIAMILCIPLSLLAARNVTQNKVAYGATRGFLNIMRTVPDLVLAIVFVQIFGIGALPGILALTILSLGILAKLISETVESIDMNPLEAMRASGANTLQMIAYGLVPQVLPQFASFTLFVFEINIRASVILGYVGAGGIGLILQQQMKFYNYDNAMVVIIVIFAIVVLIEWISKKLREAIL
ncbi:phosphonate ABC transporter, permease protein PhnE [Bacillus fonticola]|uniref:phosphonate ABC transporter, permease protein PhnE n=1 Tax=Bacillus fonticola TaxID=2728853 RepID=UPI001475C158|nr:phosphonate ABC transporter, permease protein PhnE [Bacillus fonticola]